MGCLPTCMGQRPTFISMMVLTTSFFFVEIIVGYMTNSMALVADSFHMLSDIISLFVGFFAMRYSRITNGNVFNENTFGWARAEVLGALVNSVFLVALCFSILVEALKRLVEPEELKDPNLILIVGAIGLFINIIGMFLFHGHAGHGHSHGGGGGHGHSHGDGGHGHSHDGGKHEHEAETKQKQKALEAGGVHNMSFDEENLAVMEKVKTDNKDEHAMAIEFKDQNSNENHDQHDHGKKKQKKAPKSSGQMNMRGVYLHILGDALGSIIVIIAALIIKYFDGKWTLYVDPAMSIIMVGIILKTSLPLLKESSTILLQHVPSHIELQKLQEKLLVTFPQIIAVHEFHVWQLTGNRIVASLHVMFTSSSDYDNVSPSLKKFFHQEGIHSTTVQPEFIEDEDAETQCLLACSDESCAEKVCCKPIKSDSGSTSSRSPSPVDVGKTPADTSTVTKSSKEKFEDLELGNGGASPPPTVADNNSVEIVVEKQKEDSRL